MFKYRLEKKICLLAIVKENLDLLFQEFVQQLEHIHETDPFEKILIDLGNLPMINSKAVGLIVYTFNEFRSRNIEISLCNLNHEITEIFSITGIDKIMKIYPNEEALLDM